MNRIFLSVAISCLLLLAACNKEYLTEDSMWGNNTFSCKIDGKVHVAKDDFFSTGIGTNHFLGAIPGSHSFIVHANLYTGYKNWGSIALTIKMLNK